MRFVITVSTLGFLLLALTGASPRTSSIELRIVGLKCAKGQLMIGVYDQANDFPDHDKTLKRYIFELEGKDCSSIKLKIPDLIYGKSYALAVYHDENSNYQLDKNFLGIPLERYGFSNNARGTFGPPSFKEAAFELKSQVLKLNLELK